MSACCHIDSRRRSWQLACAFATLAGPTCRVYLILRTALDFDDGIVRYLMALPYCRFYACMNALNFVNIRALTSSNCPGQRV